MAQAQAPQRQQQGATWDGLLAALAAVRDEWDGLLTHAKLKFEAEREWLLQTCEKSDYSKRLAVENIDATVAALRNVAAVGVSLDPARKLAYVLPRDKKMVYDLSYMGLIDIAVQSGSIQWAQAHLVHANDVFELPGYDAPPVHKRNPFAAPETRGNVVGAYVVVKTPGGDYLTTTLHIDDILRIRDRSQSWKEHAASNGQKKTPWASDFAEMAKKTVVKNAYKYWPRSDALDQAIHYLNTDGGQGIDLTAEDESRTLVKIWTDKVNAAVNSGALRALLPEARKAFEAAGDAAGYTAVRDRAIARDAELKNPAPGAAPAPAAAPAADPNATRAITPLEKEVAAIAAAIAGAEDDATLNTIGPRIDALPPAAQAPLNEAYNERCAYLDHKFGREAS